MYDVKKRGTKFLIRETSTKYVVKLCYNEKDAKKIVEHLNDGAGFRGETPYFFLDKRIQKYK